MSFFDDLPDLPQPPPTARDPRSCPSRAELPVGVPLSIVVGRSETAAIVLGPIQVYSEGFVIGAVVVSRTRRENSRFFDPFSRFQGQPKESIVRLAFVFADGTSAEALRAMDREGTRSLMAQGGGGDDTHWLTSFWCWPLPPPGAIEVVCAWPQHHVAETRTSFEAQPILDAAERVEKLWPERDDGSSRHSSTSYIGPS